MSAERTYTNPDCLKFIRDMKRKGWPVEHYRGRFFWQGPAVRTGGGDGDGPTLQEVMGATRVKLQRDNLAFDWIVYPVASDEGTEKA